VTIWKVTSGKHHGRGIRTHSPSRRFLPRHAATSSERARRIGRRGGQLEELGLALDSVDVESLRCPKSCRRKSTRGSE